MKQYAIIFQMPRQISTAFSDLFLALVSYFCVSRTYTSSLSATVGFFVIAVAASIGVFKFSSSNPSPALVEYHTFLSWMSSSLAVPYIAAAYHRQEESVFISTVHLATGFGLVACHKFLSESTKAIATEAISSYAVISVLALSLLKGNHGGFLGAACYIVGGALIGTKGSLLGIPRVDIFHYLIAMANYALMTGLYKIPSSVIFRPPIKQ